MLQRMADGKKHYEIVSFDPRGVGNTWPPVNCFGRSQMLARDALAIEWQGVGGLEFGETNLKHGLALQDGLGAVCANMDDDEDILSYVSTAYVARDIVEIADRIEEQRSASHKAKRFLETNSQAPLHDEVPPAAPAAGGMKHARVIYWGFSYGTLLGNTLASMFPGRMGRVILDGVADIDDYMTASWSKNLLDTEKIVDSFYDSCFEVTKDCALWKESDISSDDIRSRVNALIVDLDANPRTIVPNNGESTVRVVTGNDIRETFRQPLYSPIPTGFTNLAINIAAALKGNYSLVGGPLLPPLRDACQIDDQGTPSTMETTSSIACGDAYYAHEDASPHYGAVGFSFAYWQAYVEKLRMQSPTFMPFWSRFSSSCSGWRVKPKWGFKGPWTTPPASLDDDDAPDAPILFTSSRLDPVTPLVNAFAMSNSHPGSSVLVRQGPPFPLLPMLILKSITYLSTRISCWMDLVTVPSAAAGASASMRLSARIWTMVSCPRMERCVQTRRANRFPRTRGVWNRRRRCCKKSLGMRGVCVSLWQYPFEDKMRSSARMSRCQCRPLSVKYCIDSLLLPFVSHTCM